jgi:hypothetical protein
MIIKNHAKNVKKKKNEKQKILEKAKTRKKETRIKSCSSKTQTNFISYLFWSYGIQKDDEKRNLLFITNMNYQWLNYQTYTPLNMTMRYRWNG